MGTTTKGNTDGYIRKLEMLNRASQEFTASLDRDRIIHSLTHMIMEIADAEACSIWLCDNDADLLTCRAVSSRVNHIELIGTCLKKGQGIAGWVLETGQSARIDDPANDPHFFAGIDERMGYQTRNMIAIPIQYHGKRLGVLEAVNKKCGPFEEIDVKLAETLGASAAIALENARLFGTLRDQAQEVNDINKRLREEIDERQRAEQNLAEERNLLRTIINIIPDSIYVKDTEGRFQIANRRAVDDARLESEARIIGKTDLDIYPDSASQGWYEQEQRIIRTGEPVINEELHGIETITEGGAARDNWALVTKVPLRNQSGEIIGLVGINRDITGIKRAEAAFESERNLLRTVIDNLPDNIYVKDLEGRFLLNNHISIKRMGRHSQEDLLGKTDFDIYPADLAEKWRDEEVKILESGQIHVDEQVRAWAPNLGGVEWVERTRIPMRDRKGKINGLVGINRDITGRKRNEEELRKEHDLLNRVMETSPVAISIVSCEGQIVFANKRAEEVLGLTRDTITDRMYDAPAWRHTYFDGSPFPDEEQPFRQVIETKKPVYHIEQAIEHPDSDRILLSISGAPLLDESGAVERVVFIMEDVTERKRMENALRESEQEFRTLVENSVDAIVRLDRESHHLYVNPAFARAVGMSPEEIIGKSNDQLGVPKAMQALFDKGRYKVYETGEEQTIEFSYETPQDERYFQVRLAPEFAEDGSVETILAISRDITKRKKTEDALHKSQAILSEAEKIAQVGAWELDLTTEEFNFSDEFARIHGLSNTTISFGELLPTAHPEDLPSIEKLFRGMREGTLDDYEIEYRIIRPDLGEVRWVHALGKVLRDASGQPVKLYGATQDITERREAQAREMDLIAEREKVKVLEDFIGDVSHDLRTPITAMRLSLSVLERASEHPEMQSRHLQTLKFQTAHLEELLESMLDMVRLDRDADSNWQRVNIISLIGGVIDAQRIFAEQRGHTILYQHDADPIYVMGDPIYLERAVGNILKNAIHYTVQPDTIYVRIYRQDEVWVIEVADHGIGIGSDDLSHIFERFYRADNSRNSERGGTGLGLSIAKKIVEQHGGSIEVESVLGEGSVFRILLPSA